MPLYKVNLDYAAIDGYVTCELYRKILTLKDMLHPTWQEMLYPRCKNGEGSTNNKRSKTDEDDGW